MFKKNNKAQENREKPAKIGKNLDCVSAESYKLLRTNLSFSLPDKEGGKIIGITSPCPQDGKSTTSLNLAYSLAEGGNTVVLIDADMRRPSIAKNLEISMSPGLSNLLVDSKENAIHEKVLHDKLSVLLSGDVPPNPSELITSAKMQNLLVELSEKYDYVIVDLPPVNSVSDPIAVSKYLDGMIVVVRHRLSRRRDVLEAIRQLKMVNAKIFGFVYNGVYKGKRYRAYV